LEEVAARVGIQPSEQIAAICSDSGGNVLRAARDWQADLYNRYVSSRVPLRFEENYFLVSLPCLAHAIHNGVKNGIEEVSSVKDTITKLREINMWIRNSQVHSQRLKRIQEDQGLKVKVPQRDNETRWHSTQDVLERHIELRPALLQLVQEVMADKSLRNGESYTASYKDDILKDEYITKRSHEINNLLREIRRYSRLLETQEPFSLTFVLLVYTILCRIVLLPSEEDDNCIKDFKKVIKDYIEKRINQQELGGAIITCVLDPRFHKPEVILGKNIPAGTYQIHWKL
jgi:signal transduction histidine kinase